METQYILGFIGILLSVIGFLIVFVLNGIKGEIRDVNTKLEKIESDLHQRVTDVDRRQREQNVEFERRISKIEARCEAKHDD
jgi:hypothetical protein